jgi:DNA-binding transcriptional regulator YhcF (GntR family)
LSLRYDHPVLAEIRTRIVLGRLPGGEAIRLSDLADELGVSLAPVRDALLRLAERGLVQHSGGRGFFVVSISVAERVELAKLLHFIVKSSIVQGSVDRTGLRRIVLASDCTTDGLDSLLSDFLEQVCSPSTKSIVANIMDRTWELRAALLGDSALCSRGFRTLKLLMQCLVRRRDGRAIDILDRVCTHVVFEVIPAM